MNNQKNYQVDQHSNQHEENLFAYGPQEFYDYNKDPNSFVELIPEICFNDLQKSFKKINEKKENI